MPGRPVGRMRDLLEEFSAGKGSLEDLEELHSLSEAVKDGSLCALGGSAPNPVLTTILYFRDEYQAHIEDKKCPAGVCKPLFHYEIDAEACTGCTLCVQLGCPAVMFDKDSKKAKIDEINCVDCNLCVQVCSFEAIAVEGAEA